MRGEPKKFSIADIIDQTPEGEEVIFSIRPTKSWYLLSGAMVLLLLLCVILSFLVWNNDRRLEKIEEGRRVNENTNTTAK